MIVRIIKKYEQWEIGATPDVHRSIAKRLIADGFAVLAQPGEGEILPVSDKEPEQHIVTHVHVNASDLEEEPEEEITEEQPVFRYNTKKKSKK